MRKPKLSVDEQINYMKDIKGIEFNIVDESTAKQFLLNNNYYFKTKAYAKNYNKYLSGKNLGKYINLEFAYLQELSTMDMYLRKIIIRMALDIEHFLKTQMLRDFVENDEEDGYTVVADFLSKNPNIVGNINNKKKQLSMWQSDYKVSK